MQPHSTVSTRLLFSLLAAIFAVQVYQAATLPIDTSEAYLYDSFVRPTARQVWAQELPDRDVLYSLLEKRSVGLFHVSPLAVRLPSLLFGVLYLWAVWGLARLATGVSPWCQIAAAVASVAPVAWGLFSRAEGTGTALALMVCAASCALRYLSQNEPVSAIYLNLTGACLGLAVAARLDFAIPAAIVSLCLLAVLGRRRLWTVWSDRVLIPALVVALVPLVLPLSHAQAASENSARLTGRQSAAVQAALRVLRSAAGNRPVAIAAAPGIAPVVNFYRAQQRLTNWGRALPADSTPTADYVLLSGIDRAGLAERHLVVVFEDSGIALARQRYAAM